jgi:hypothetical protein
MTKLIEGAAESGVNVKITYYNRFENEREVVLEKDV